MAALAAVLATVALLAVQTATAEASRTQETMMEDSAQLLFSGPDNRAAALDEFQRLGVDVVKLRVVWRRIAPNGESRRTPRFDAADPAAYPQENWEALDSAVKGATERGMRVLLMISPPSPEWATTRRSLRGQVGVYKTDPADFARFVEALGHRYSGGFTDPNASAPAEPGALAPRLPRVSFWSIWNEPNHPQFIQPLSERLGGQLMPSSPHQYRRLYVAGEAGLRRSGHYRDTTLFGEILPIGQSRLGSTNTLRPIHFLREFFCVDENYKRLRGSAAAVRGCSRFPRMRMDGFAYHAYTRPLGPRVKLTSGDDATIGQMRRVERALDKLAQTRRIRRRIPIYNTEFGLQTNPPDCGGFGTSLRNQAAFINEAEYLSYIRPRLRTYSQYLLIDDRLLTDYRAGDPRRYGGFQSGLRYGADAVRCDSPGVKLEYASEKPSYDAFRTPIYVRDLGKGRVQVFGKARPRRNEFQRIEILAGGKVVATANARGYFLTTLRGSSRATWQLRWEHEGETYRSRRTRALKDIPRSRL